MLRIPVLCVVASCCAVVPVPVAIGQAPTADEVPEGLAAADWASIREAYEAGRHAAHPVEGGYQARNPGQRWRTRFDGRGFLTLPDAGSWSWGLQLLRYGFVGGELEVTSPLRVSAEGQRVAYDWDDTLTEWYVNDTRGLEHGYTVHRRPVDDERGDEAGPLIFTLAVRGELVPQVAADGRGVRFVNDDGAAVLTYSGLAVFDADGHTLPANFERIAEGLLLSVDERGALYPLTIDPVAQQAYLKASNTDAIDLFGRSVGVSGDTVVVGAYQEDSSATGVNGDQSDNSASHSGAAYVFVRNGMSWSQQAYLKASNTDENDNFGLAVAVSGDKVVVGAYQEDSNATGVNGDQSDNSATFAGAAYVFVRSGTSWSQQAYLKASTNTFAGGRFGWSVSVSGDTVVVGAWGESSNATGVNGNQDDNSAPGSGAAYVFVRSGTDWSQQAYLKASNAEGGDFLSGDEFGISVSVSGDTVVVGAWYEDSDATGVNGDQGNNFAFDSGAAYVFVRSGTSWSQQAYLKASNTDGGVFPCDSGDLFGWSVSVSGDTMVVGARTEDSNATGVNGDQSNNSGGDSGAAYVFVRSGASWGQQAYLKASNTDLGEQFGRSVSVSGNALVVGAIFEDSKATGVNGNQNDSSAQGAGAAYIFVRSGTSWTQLAYLKASNTNVDDHFGSTVAVSGNTVVVGAVGEDSIATGVDGDQGNNSAPAAGAAYVFDLGATEWIDFGCSLAGASGNPLLVGTGTLVDGSNNSIDLSNAATSAPCGLFVALSSTPVPFKGGTLKPFPFLIEPIILATSPAGTLPLPFTMPSGLPSGTTLWFQYGIQDAAANFGVSLSNAVVGTTP